MDPIQILMEEHAILNMALDGTDRYVAAMRRGGACDAAFVRRMLVLMRGFAAACHQRKEEQALYPALVEFQGPGVREAVATLAGEHADVRDLLRILEEDLDEAEKGESGCVQAMTETLSAYSSLMRAHLAREERMVYPLVRRLPGRRQDEIIHRFANIEEEMPKGSHETYYQIARDLAGDLHGADN